jgi:FtsP/CotA-like multicopper oxidase with cupredoxin domain
MEVHHLIFGLLTQEEKSRSCANDGNDVEPVEVDRLISVSETYDVVVTIPAANTSYEF